MTEAATTENTQETQETSEQHTEQREQRNNEVQIPKSRFDEVSKRAKSAESELQKLKAEQQQREEEAATKQGEWQTVAEKRQAKIDQANARIKELEDQIVRDKRFRAWTQAAAGVVRADAVADAFDKYLTSEDWSTVNEDDENSVRMLAQGLVERRSYLAGGPVGAGSGGSSRPVLGLSSNKNVDDRRSTTLSSGRETFSSFKKNRSHWK